MKSTLLTLLLCTGIYVSQARCEKPSWVNFESTTPIANPGFVSNITDTDVKYLKAERLYNSKKYDESKKLMQEYLAESKGKIDPNFTPYLYLASCDYIAKNYDGALANFKKDLEFDDTRSLYNVAAVYAVKGDAVNALAWLAKDQSSKDAYPKALILKDKDWMAFSANEEFKRIMQQDKRPAFKKYVDSCDYYVGTSDLAMAMKMINEAIKAEPLNPKGYHGKGSLFMMQKEFKNAIMEFEKENEIESDASFTGVKKYMGYQQMGQAYIDLGNYQAMILNTKIALSGNKTFYPGSFDLATYQIRERNYEDAKKVMLEYIRIADDDDFAYYMAALSCSYLNDTAKQKEYAQKAIDLSKAYGADPPKEYYKLLGN